MDIQAIIDAGMRKCAEVATPQPGPRGPQTVPSDVIIGKCHYCSGPLYLYEPRVGMGAEAHYSCAEEVQDGEDRPVLVSSDERRRYRESLATVKTRTLAAMVNTYDDLPEERLPEHAWMVSLVHSELSRREGLPQW